MKEEVFINKNISKWQQLEEYNKTVGKKGITNLSESDIRAFTDLFRLASHHLGYSRTHFSNSKTTIYLNQIVSIAHNYFFTKEKNDLSHMLHYCKRGFKELVMANKDFIVTAALTFLAGIFFALIICLVKHEYIYYFIPEESLQTINFDATDRQWDHMLMSSYIMTNNIKVSFMALVSGIFVGVGTLYILFTNGLLIGALTYVVIMSRASLLTFLSLILPHGFIELAAIFISGGAGLIIGKSMLIPKTLSRKDSLIKGAKEAAKLIPGVIMMLIIAGLIEGFITPLNIPASIKLIFALLTLVAMAFYFRVNSYSSHTRNN